MKRTKAERIIANFFGVFDIVLFLSIWNYSTFLFCGKLHGDLCVSVKSNREDEENDKNQCYSQPVDRRLDFAKQIFLFVSISFYFIFLFEFRHKIKQKKNRTKWLRETKWIKTERIESAL